MYFESRVPDYESSTVIYDRPKEVSQVENLEYHQTELLRVCLPPLNNVQEFYIVVTHWGSEGLRIYEKEIQMPTSVVWEAPWLSITEEWMKIRQLELDERKVVNQ